MSSRLCQVCSSIEISEPVSGPQIDETRRPLPTIFHFEQHAVPLDVKHAADAGCSMCYVLWQKIDQEDNRDAITVVDDWECIDEDFEEDSGEELLAKSCNDTTIDLSSVDNPVLLEFVSRSARRDELKTRAIDIRVHWTTKGERKVVDAMSLVTGLDGEKIWYHWMC